MQHGINGFYSTGNSKIYQKLAALFEAFDYATVNSLPPTLYPNYNIKQTHSSFLQLAKEVTNSIKKNSKKKSAWVGSTAAACKFVVVLIYVCVCLREPLTP